MRLKTGQVSTLVLTCQGVGHTTCGEWTKRMNRNMYFPSQPQTSMHANSPVYPGFFLFQRLAFLLDPAAVDDVALVGNGGAVVRREKQNQSCDLFRKDHSLQRLPRQNFCFVSLREP